jgi:hypothetical protein
VARLKGLSTHAKLAGVGTIQFRIARTIAPHT